MCCQCLSTYLWAFLCLSLLLFVLFPFTLLSLMLFIYYYVDLNLLPSFPSLSPSSHFLIPFVPSLLHLHFSPFLASSSHLAHAFLLLSFPRLRLSVLYFFTSFPLLFYSFPCLLHLFPLLMTSFFPALCFPHPTVFSLPLNCSSR